METAKNKLQTQPDEDSLIDYNLSLNPEQRLINHQRALDTINELKKAGKKLYGESYPSSEEAPRK